MNIIFSTPQEKKYISSMISLSQKLTMKTDKFNNILEKLKKFCSYQDRAVFDIAIKAEKYGLSNTDTMKAVKILKNEGFIDEYRYAVNFATSKLKYNKWGKIKIRQHLLSKKIDRIIVEQAIQNIDTQLYINALKEIIEKKSLSLKKTGKEAHFFAKLVSYVLSKGFEHELIFEILKKND